MSTCYHLACDKHKESCDAANRSGTITLMADAEETLPAFIYAHAQCNLNVYQTDSLPVNYDEWETHNKQDLLDQAEARLCSGCGMEKVPLVQGACAECRGEWM